MKKLMFVAVAAIGLMAASCAKEQKMSPEAAEAWSEFKAAAKDLSTIDTNQDFEALQAVVDKWINATDTIGTYYTEYSPEIIDSINDISERVIEDVQRVIEAQLTAQKEENDAEVTEDETNEQEVNAEEAEKGQQTADSGV